MTSKTSTRPRRSSTTSADGQAVIKTVRRISAPTDEILTLSTGVHVRLHPIPLALIAEAQDSLEAPEVPKVWIEDKGREEPNPNHPAYVQALEDYTLRRNMASIDATILHGVELVDEDGNPMGTPADLRWLKKLQFAAKLGHINLDEFDLEDELTQEYLYKKYVAVATPDMALINGILGLSPQEVEKAEAAFLGN